jgi:hypothetical protein
VAEPATPVVDQPSTRRLMKANRPSIGRTLSISAAPASGRALTAAIRLAGGGRGVLPFVPHAFERTTPSAARPTGVSFARTLFARNKSQLLESPCALGYARAG